MSIYLVRHSVRQAAVDAKNWVESTRFTENIYDDPITSAGVELAKDKALKLLEEDLPVDTIDYIYCSPMTRCIETALVMSLTIEAKTGKKLPIRVEYGLRECDVYGFDSIELSDGAAFAKQKSPFDNKLTRDAIIERFASETERFDCTYESMSKFDEFKTVRSSVADELNSAIKCAHDIVEANQGKNIFICLHAGSMTGVACALSKNQWSSELFNKFAGQNFCATAKIDLTVKPTEPETNVAESV